MNSAPVLLLLAVFVVAYWLGSRTRHKTVVEYGPVDLRDELSKHGRALRGRRLTGTTFVGSGEGDAFDATRSLIWLACNVADSDREASNG